MFIRKSLILWLVTNKKGEGRCSFTFLLSVDGKYHPFKCVVLGLQLLFGKNLV